jgi:multicomponent Na+:H+ antiporter subunit B
MNGMGLIVKTVAGAAVRVAMLYGVYLGLVGHLSLGGGITGGVIVALALILEVLAYGIKAQELNRRIKGMTQIMSSVFIVWLSIALIGWLLPGKETKFFLSNFLPPGEAGALVSAGVIPLYNILLLLGLGSALFAAFLALIKFRVSVIEGKK